MHALETLILDLATSLPLSLFVFLGSLIEEAIPPIPSPSIIILAGSFAFVQHYTLIDLFHLLLFASIGKTIGGLTVYILMHILRGPLVQSFGKYMHIHESDIEAFGSRFTGGVRDYIVYTTLRSLPIVPSVILSCGAGIIRLPLRVFVTGTFIGTIIRDAFYLFVGYSGGTLLVRLVDHTNTLEKILLYTSALLVCTWVLYRFFKKKRNPS